MEAATILVAVTGAGSVSCCAGAHLARKCVSTDARLRAKQERKLQELQDTLQDLAQSVKENEQVYTTLEQYVDEEIDIADEVMDKFEGYVSEYPPEHTTAIQAAQGMEDAINDMLKDCQDIAEISRQTVDKHGANKGPGAAKDKLLTEGTRTHGAGNLEQKFKRNEERVTKAHHKLEELMLMIETIQIEVVHEAKRAAEIQEETENLRFPNVEHIDRICEKYEALHDKYTEAHAHREQLARDLDHHQASYEQERSNHLSTKKKLRESQTVEGQVQESDEAKSELMSPALVFAAPVRVSAANPRQEDQSSNPTEQRLARLQRDLDQSQRENGRLQLEVTASKKELTDARAKLRIASETSGTERAAGAMAQATREKDLAQRQQDQVVKEKNSLQEKLGKYKADFEQTQKDKFYAEERCKHLQKELDKVKEEVNGHRAASTIAKREADEAKRSQGCAQNDATALKSQLKTLQEAKGKADAQVKQLQDRNAQLEGELRASKEAAGKAKPDSGVDTHTLKRLTDENHRLKQELDEKTKDQAKLWSKIESQTRAIEKEKEAFQKDLASTRGPLSSTPMRSSSSLSYERSAPGGAKTSLAVSSPMSAKVAASTPSEPTTGRKFLVFDKDEVKATSTNLRSTASPLPLRSAELPESETGGTRRRFMP